MLTHIIITIFALLTHVIIDSTDLECTISKKVPRVKYVDFVVHRTKTYTAKCRGIFGRTYDCVQVGQFTEIEPRTKLVYETIEEKVCCDGYTKASDGSCTPVCSLDCLNGKCTAPEQCSCFDGYEQESSYRCTPICSRCKNGDCVAPETCQCHKGYRTNPNFISGSNDIDACEPECEHECENARCSAPNTCECLKGYSPSPELNYRCEPVCDKSNCTHGSCVAPNVCECDDGYRKILVFDGFHERCHPICTEGCHNGFCVAPNTCECYPGYELSSDPSECHPVCEASCLNGRCVEPNKCECLSGYAPEDNNLAVCMPICENSIDNCENGRCVAPNTCECDEGYELQKVFAEGFKQQCVPVCNETCVNAICVAPDICNCTEGYVYANESAAICEPYCSEPCENGFCAAPDDCSCNEGFEKNDENLCLLKCDPACDFGTCQNGTCVCDEGYVAVDEGSHECRPFCEACTRGICLGNNTCICEEGFELKDDDCHPICSEGCGENEVCERPEFCACVEGFDLMVNETFTLENSTQVINGSCVPVCGLNDPGTCLNGTCIEPGVCECPDGLNFDNEDFSCVEFVAVTSDKIEYNTGVSPFLIIAIICAILILVAGVAYYAYNRKVSYNVQSQTPRSENPIYNPHDEEYHQD